MNSDDGVEIKLAWAISVALEKLSSLLWERYGDEFLELHMEEEEIAGPRRPVPEEP